jgi:hypothetical protein
MMMAASTLFAIALANTAQTKMPVAAKKTAPPAYPLQPSPQLLLN